MSLDPTVAPDGHGCAQASLQRARGPAPAWRLVLAILGTAAFIVCVDNVPLWHAALGATATDAHRGSILVALLVLQLCSLIVPLACAPGVMGFKIAGIVLLLVAAFADFFMSEYGVIIDPSMIRNVAETTWTEAGSLVSPELLVHLVLFGLIPAFLLAYIPLGRAARVTSLSTRAGLVLASLAALFAVLQPNFAAISFFAHEHRELRLFMNPGYPIHAALRFIDDQAASVAAAPVAVAGDARRTASAMDRPTLVVFVLGETARADRFSVNGYARDTNRYTRGLELINFPQVSSCATSTADSVPCLFSHLGRERFDHGSAARHENLLGMLSRVGIDVLWRDNNTGCQHVCDPLRFEGLEAGPDPELCATEVCFDEILLRGLEARVADASKDHLIVLHQRGSHGPEYYKDAPPWAKAYFPECDRVNVRNCSQTEIDNAYDNTILYTDFLLAKVIEFLQGQQASYEVAMVYLSDHGESLGEYGLYLHGFPYRLAPEQQTHVPMMLWAGESLLQLLGTDRACIQRAAAEPRTHDALFHTMLTLLRVESSLYRPELDVLGACRVPGTRQARAPSAGPRSGA